MEAESFELPSLWDYRPDQVYLPQEVNHRASEVILPTVSQGDCDLAKRQVPLYGGRPEGIVTELANCVVGLSRALPNVRGVKVRVEVPQVANVRYTVAPIEVQRALETECSLLGAEIEVEVVVDEKLNDRILGYDGVAAVKSYHRLYFGD